VINHRLDVCKRLFVPMQCESSTISLEEHCEQIEIE